MRQCSLTSGMAQDDVDETAHQMPRGFIDRVNWYYREGFFKAFVEGLNDLRSTKDTFT